MKFLAHLLTVATCAAAASALEIHEPSPEGKIVPNDVCPTTVEQIKARAVGQDTYTYSIPELVAIKEQLRQNNDCSHPRGDSSKQITYAQRAPILVPRAAPAYAHSRHVPKCVNAIVPGMEDQQGYGSSGASGAMLSQLSVVALTLAIAALQVA